MPYESSGTLTTDKRDVTIDTTWSSQTDWEAYQSKNNVVINSGTLELAESAQIIDNYNSNSAGGPYGSGDDLTTYYSGAGTFQRRSSNAIEGDYSLAYDQTTGGDMLFSYPGDGLPLYPDPGDSIRFLLKPEDFTTFAFGLEDTGSGPGGYLALLKDGDMRLRRLDDTVTDLVTSSPSVTPSDWYWGEVRSPDSTDSTITFDVYQLNTSDLSRGSQVDSLSTSDGTYTGRGIGTRAGTDGLNHEAIDDIRVI